ncbi:MAG: (d)CMP kinase [Flavobacteriaceae bacterium]|nr:(d)CMP kinase [Flavobacteriaceae bacterium]MDG1344171.1 (d)CMP kinase [Flavobacteriaceae bacterium]MDG1791725.1 (d)CMP kinase [Flavobacteriaceae bacterium]MDG2485152.1 (d)CMP kinase [Flavobacteriaceae bacterium]
MSNKIIIAIDGTSSTGKSTLAKRISKKLNYKYIDSGAMYRALTYYAIQQKYISKNHFDKIKLINDIPYIYIDFRKNSTNNKYEVHLNGIPYENKIRSLAVSNLVSEIATVDELRQQMVRVQHTLGLKKGVIMDGRDIGTVVFPDAEIKFYLEATMELRAKRRFDELFLIDKKITYGEVLANIKLRDNQDTNRKHSPLKKANDAILINTDNLTLDELELKLFTYINPLITKNL